MMTSWRPGRCSFPLVNESGLEIPRIMHLFVFSSLSLFPWDSAPSRYTQVFFILEGAVNARINDSNFTVCTGGMFHVPRGTVYHIENIASRDTRILFMQARRPASAGLVPSRQSSMALGEPSHRYMSNSREPSVPVRVKVEKIGGKGRKVRREETIEEEEEEEEQEQSEEEGRRKKAKKANGPKR